MLGRVLWWGSIAWLSLCVAIVAASLWSWINQPQGPHRGETTIAAAIGVLYAAPAFGTVLWLSWSARFRQWRAERTLAWAVIALGILLVAAFELVVS